MKHFYMRSRVITLFGLIPQADASVAQFLCPFMCQGASVAWWQRAESETRSKLLTTVYVSGDLLGSVASLSAMQIVEIAFKGSYIHFKQLLR